MILESISREAASAGLRFVGLSDHVDRVEDSGRPLLNRGSLAGDSWDVEFIVGTEATVLSPGRMAITDAIAEQLDYVMVSGNHYHLRNVENPDRKTAPSYAGHYLKMIQGTMEWGLANMVAHPFLHSKLRRIMDPMDVLEHYDWDQVEQVIALAGERELAFEMRPGYATIATEFFREIVRICQRHGAKFSLGSDAHRLREVAYPDGFQGELEMLGIRQRDLIDPNRFVNSKA
jgi:histidinol phosphatase-like PHP family hydrolase